MADLRPTTSRLQERISPERTRRATFAERLTVRKLSWDSIVRLNAYLELAGRVATALWVAFLASVVVGVDWESVVDDAVNSGRHVKAALVLAIALPTALFLLARSLLVAGRWRLQRELWRRDVERLEGQSTPLSESTTRNRSPRR